MEKKLISNDYRKGYILALDSCLREGFIVEHEKELLIQAFDKMYEVKVSTIKEGGELDVRYCKHVN